MSTYTSPSPANVSLNGNKTTWWIPATNLGALPVKNVKVTVTVAPANGLQLFSFTPDVGSYNPNTGVWTIGTLNPGIENRKWLRLVTSVVDIGLAPFTITSVISGDGVDPNNVNNTLVQTVAPVATAATAGAVDDLNMCHCGNVSCNDTPCNYGETKYVLDEDSVTNSTEYCWDELTGEYKFIPDNPYYDVTFQYSIWCNGVEISGPAKVQINKLFKDMSSFDHTLEIICPSKLKDKDKLVLEAQHPGVTVSTYCWRVLRNSLGVITSSEQIPPEDVDTRTFYFCSEEGCQINCPALDGLPADVVSQFPTGYVPQKGDTIVIYHVDSICVWIYDGASWNKWSCGCQYKISKDAGNLLSLGSDNAPYLDLSSLPTGKELVSAAFSGTTTKTLTLTFDDGSSITASFVDNEGSGGTTADGSETKVTAGSNVTITGSGTTASPYVINSNSPDGSETKVTAGSNVTITGTGTTSNPYVINSTATASATYINVTDSCSINMSVSGSGTVANPFVISAEVYNQSIAPTYVSGTRGSTNQVFNVSSLFADPCPTGCVASYTLKGYPTDVYENVTLFGTTLTYSVKSTAPSGTHDINIERTCA